MSSATRSAPLVSQQALSPSRAGNLGRDGFPCAVPAHFRATWVEVAICGSAIGGNTTVVLDRADAAWICAGFKLYVCRTKTTVFVRAHEKGTKRQTRLAKLLMKPPAGFVVDHINGNPLDNRRCNLRVVTPQDNNRNRAKRKGCSSGFKGVSAKDGKWAAVIYNNYKQTRLGVFDDELAAAQAYDAAARLLFGEAAALNFPKAFEQSAHRTRTIEYFHSEGL